MPDKKILFYPRFGENQYTENTYECLQTFSTDIQAVEPINFSVLKSGFHHYDVAVVHWLDNTLVTKAKTISVISVTKFFIKLCILKWVARRIIYVRHNLYPHALHGAAAKIARRLIDMACRVSDRCVVHSGHLAGGNTSYIPHPLYQFDSEREVTLAQATGPYIVFGRIVEYKAIDRLLESWEGERLLIAGKVDSAAYLDRLQEIIERRKLGGQVSLEARFISDQEAAMAVSASHGLILTHSDEDMIVSGSFFFAVSLGVPVYAVTTPFFEWLENTYNYPGLFIYDDIPALITGLNTHQEIDRAALKTAARSLFGQDVVSAAWRNFLIKLS
ncbi:Glycosyltransferase involved in cell wall bisynthesis [Methylophilus rhizosphaerae]|uniref:Glycosyltransferase involved in cell wall bisynthesis n=1 Tax=Methylophilus rhizosphaerae TaxID=492660 RepID=A0A1G8Z0U6_9PROT|nr:hypothetical protein [Methylophilus rhizosphaerae]SDK08597.1 Glycosyltransferase involved in cell wall bisynthesis [Methylophilus rhizosphaerae]